MSETLMAVLAILISLASMVLNFHTMRVIRRTDRLRVETMQMRADRLRGGEL